MRPHRARSPRTRTLASIALLALTPLLALADTEAGALRSLVIVGGGLSPDNRPVFEAILERKLPRGPICVLPTASAEPVDSAHGYVKDFERYGGDGAAVAVNLTTRNPEKASDPRFAAQLEQCGGYFFTGGDQSRIVDVLRPGGEDTPAAAALRRTHAEGAVISGSSAGAAMMSDPMVGAGSSRDALRHGVTRRESGKGVWVRTGMGFLDAGLTGQHFLARGRLGRHLVALAAHPAERIGIGVDEDTAAVLDGDRLSVLGRSQVAVTVVDTKADQAADLAGRLWLLGDGDRFDAGEGLATPAQDKRPLGTVRAAPEPPSDPFEDDRLHRFFVNFARSTLRETSVTSGQARLSLSKPEDFAAWAREDGSPEPLPSGFGGGPLVFRLELPEDDQ
jgi:cyanophycinase